MIDVVDDWMREKKLTLAHHKTEMLLISNHKVVQQGSVGECIINSKREVRQLVVISSLIRTTPNNWAVNSSKKRLLAGPAWVTALQTKCNTSRLNSTFRLMAIRVFSAYRTVSSEAAYVIPIRNT
ncbi:uncharacterized protein LOC131687883 [Topomyia yanbarensis]|uniref:uncharacterized protein LOC131687883 n=1 Tax=Topomyia yanbarensis TaxID=2498891 RepID=UPI00273C6922|nr:uncharacterized protein LOC131687883 [Topomyia yanbarensis]